MYLRSWWSNKYNRPLKDPLLSEYSTYELVYEYYDTIERKNAADHAIEQENDKIEDSKAKEVLDWAEEEERKEREALDAKKQQEEQWMLDQLKKEHGEDFGGDINLDF